jgi:hypothetical protein
VYFKLTSTGRAVLASAHNHRLPVTVVASDISNTSAATTMNLIPFTTIGRGPRRNTAPAGALRIIGSRHFVYRARTGGILASCSGAAPCHVKTKIRAGRRKIAVTGPELIGANEAGYLSFKLGPVGRSLLAGALGNQLRVHVTLTALSGADTGGEVTAKAAVTLTSFR